MEIPKYIELYRRDLILKNYADTSIENYVSQVKLFLSDHNKQFTEPSKINENAIKEWLLKANTINSRKHRISALKLFYHHTIKQPLKFKNIEYPRSDKKLPIVLSVEEIQRMFDVCENKKHKVILGLLYSCSLRVSELINLKWKDIDRSRMVINILQAKGKKDRQVGLNQPLITLLEDYLNNRLFGVEFRFKIVLIGKEVDKSDFVYSLNHINNLSVYLYNYDFDGVSFKNAGKSWGLTNNGFKYE